MSTSSLSDPRYECGVCGGDFPGTAGARTCDEHFYCNECAVEAFHRAMNNMNEFPASCCARAPSGLPRAPFEDQLSDDFKLKYMLKLNEHNTPEAVRVYCANAQCAKHMQSEKFDDSDQRHTVARCECGMLTCVGCKDEWKPDHICAQTNPMTKPSWVPQYSSTCRTKQCPQCREWIELSEACNHMVCSSCHYSFCFVCLLNWRGFHEPAGCPPYGDPLAGYDSQGFELNERGLHVYTGRDRNGYNRRGVNVFGEVLDGATGDPEGEDEDEFAEFENWTEEQYRLRYERREQEEEERLEAEWRQREEERERYAAERLEAEWRQREEENEQEMARWDEDEWRQEQAENMYYQMEEAERQQERREQEEARAREEAEAVGTAFEALYGRGHVDQHE